MKVVKVVLALIAVAVAGVGVFVVTKKPEQRPAANWKIESTPPRVARGAHLAYVLGCRECHTKTDSTRFAFPPAEGAEPLAGGTCYGAKWGMPGKLCMSNITPDEETGIGSWTDGEIARAIREGVDKDGRVLFPMMPYTYYRQLSDDDTKALIAYLRTVAPVKNAVPEPDIMFPVSFFIKMAPKPLAGPVPHPDLTDKAALGQYLGKMICKGCHTPVDDRHQPLPGMDFAGGQEFIAPWGSNFSSNITPHEGTGLAWQEDEFIARFKSYANTASVAVKLDNMEHQTLMPWLSLSRLTEEELSAVYAYLRTQKPVDHEVVRFKKKAARGR